MLSSLEKIVLEKILPIKNTLCFQWVELLRDSLSFTAYEKYTFIKKYPSYTKQQVDKFIKILLKEQDKNKELKNKYPDKFIVSDKSRSSAWESVLKKISLLK